MAVCYRFHGKDRSIIFVTAKKIAWKWFSANS